MVRTAVLVFAFFCAGVLFAGGWWDTNWPYRRQVRLEQGGAGFTEWAHARFWACAPLKKDGSDIRVVTPDGRVCKSIVIWAEPYGRVEVVFKTRKGVRRYFVYYGNPKAPALEVKERPHVGLVMETRSRPRGPCNSWADFRRLLARSTHIYGRAVVDKIFHGFNPFGPSDHYITIYRGWLWVPKDGKYRIATNSDDSSFVFIDGKMVVAWPGEHGPTAVYGERNAEIELTKGLHRIEYYHEERTGGQACVLGWWRPGDRRVSLVAEHFFPGFLRTKVGRLQKWGAGLVAEILARPVSEALLPDGHLIVEVAFRGDCYPKFENAVFEWDFGDGQTAKGQKVRHLFLHPGRYRVRLRVKAGGKESVAFLEGYVGVSFFYRHRPRAKEFCRALADYDLSKLDSKAIEAVVALAEVAEDDDLRLKALEAGLEKRAFRGRHLFAALRDAGRLLVAHEGSAERAEGYFKRLLDEAREPWWKAQAQLGLADVLFFLRRNFKEALGAYARIVTRYARESPGCAKRAQIRLGDVHRIMGHFKEAMSAYRRARFMSAMFYREDAAVRRGKFILEVHHLIESGQLSQALRRIEDWEWQLPEDKLTTELSLFKARALARSGRWKLALLELEGFVNANTATDCPKSANCLPETMLALAKVRMKLGMREEALALLKEIVEQHAEVKDVHAEAQRLLAKWSSPPQKK